MEGGATIKNRGIGVLEEMFAICKRWVTIKEWGEMNKEEGVGSGDGGRAIG